jgi:Ca2+-binding RTX toxin-like protein
LEQEKMPGSGGRSRGSGSNQFSLKYEFDLFTLRADEVTPTTFSGALENFNGSFSESNGGRPPTFDFFLEDYNPDLISSYSIDFGTQTADLKASINGTQIQYEVSNSKLTDLGVTKLTLNINDADGNLSNGFQVQERDPNTGQILGDSKTIDQNKATANGVTESEAIEYIVSEDLFGYVESASVSGKNVVEGETSPDGKKTYIPGSDITTEGAFITQSTFTKTSTDPNPDPSSNGDDVFTGDNGDNTLNGGEGNNVLRGQEGNDVLTSGAGSDNLDGGNGDDDLSSGGGNDILTGGAGSDLFDCGDGNDTVDGGDGNDDIFGAGGDDLLRGGNGDDIINGGAGLDVLVGDGGADIFEIGTSGGADILRDFNYGQDLIGLSDGITFEDLIVTQGDGAAILSYQDQAIASISGGTPGQINASLFTEI